MGVMCVYICVIYERLLFDMCTCKFLCVCMCTRICTYVFHMCMYEQVCVHTYMCVLAGYVYNSMCMLVHLCVACVSICVLYI